MAQNIKTIGFRQRTISITSHSSFVSICIQILSCHMNPFPGLFVNKTKQKIVDTCLLITDFGKSPVVKLLEMLNPELYVTHFVSLVSRITFNKSNYFKPTLNLYMKRRNSYEVTLFGMFCILSNYGPQAGRRPLRLIPFFFGHPSPCTLCLHIHIFQISVCFCHRRHASYVG